MNICICSDSLVIGIVIGVLMTTLMAAWSVFNVKSIRKWLRIR